MPGPPRLACPVVVSSRPPSADPLDLDRLGGEITDLVRQASRLALAWFRRDPQVHDKGEAGFDPVTEADRAVEDHLRAALAERFPDHEIVGEERGASGSGLYRWLIDPIDGTRAFISGNPLWGTLLGLQHDGRPVAGWLHQPTMDETWVAAGRATWHDSAQGRRALRTRDVTALADATVLCTTPAMFAGAEADAFARVTAAARLTRYGGDCINYGLVAAGFADVVVDNDLAPYDIVPLIPILEAAGAVVTDRDGRPPLAGGFVVAAATPRLHAAVLDLVGR
jgi:histidinol phosphatase-like enzyme (inositol monophosphatase family)